MTRLPTVLLGLGALVLATSAAWWWITYGEVIRYNYISAGEAGVCLLGDSEICRLARALCRGAHPVSVVAYRAAAFWIGLAALSASLMAPGRRPDYGRGAANEGDVRRWRP
jgi:hypothetical protein